jgi:dolichol kinase
MDPSLSISQALFIGIKTVVVAAIVESLPWKINDNISVPLASAIVLNFLLAV